MGSGHLVRDSLCTSCPQSISPELTRPQCQPGPHARPGQSPLPHRTQGLPRWHCWPFIPEGTRPSTSSVIPQSTASWTQGPGNRPHGALNIPGRAEGAWVLPEGKLDHHTPLGIMKHLSTPSACPHHPMSPAPRWHDCPPLEPCRTGAVAAPPQNAVTSLLQGMARAPRVPAHQKAAPGGRPRHGRQLPTGVPVCPPPASVP